MSARTNKTLGFWSDLGAHATLKNGEVIDNCDIIFLAMKPHILDDALEGVSTTMLKRPDDKLFVSVLVGVSLDTLYNVRVNLISKNMIHHTSPKEEA